MLNPPAARTPPSQTNRGADPLASGRFRAPQLPEGLSGFSGELLHAFDYPGAEGFAGRRVLVYGNGVSGHEIASDIASVTPTVHSYRKPRYVLRKNLDGVASDLPSCGLPNGPRGPGSIRARFDPDGTVMHVTLSPPYAGTAVGQCISQRFQAAKISPFVPPSIAFNYVFTSIAQ